MGRINAALVHLLISVFVFAVFLSLVFFIWYAYPFNITEGVGDIVYMMAGIDIVLGPLLTLVVFNTAKKSLKFDLSLIGIIQVSALIYGGFVIYSERPAWVVFVKDRFHVVGVMEVDTSKIPDKSLSVGILDRPKMVFAELPVGEKRDDILFQAIAGGADIDRTPELYRRYEPYKSEVVRASKEFSQHFDLKSENEVESKGFKWLPMEGKLKDIVVIVDVESQAVSHYKMLNPWKIVQTQ